MKKIFLSLIICFLVLQSNAQNDSIDIQHYDINLDINNLEFGGFTLNSCNAAGDIIERSDDLKIKGLLELHEHCAEYLGKYDDFCANYLEAIASKLPLSEGNSRYFAFEKNLTPK